MNHSKELYDMLSPLATIHTSPISLLKQHLADFSMWSPKDDGPTKTDLNISLSGPNIPNSIYVSYSAIVTPELQKEVESLTRMYVQAMEEVFSKV